MSLLNYSQEQIKQLSMIELAFEIMVAKKQAIGFPELVTEIAKLLELSDEDVRKRMSQFYTDLNIDGRFIAVGENRWGLRSWYPYDQIEEEIIPAAKPKKKRKAKDDEDDLDLDDFDEIDEEEYDELDDLDEIDEEEEDDLLDDDDDDEEDDDLDDDLLDEDDDYDLDEDLDEEDEDLDEEEELEDLEEDEEDL
ncbi:DNA-directed RNA polymerase subunit delta [Bacillus sp. AK128]